MPEPLEKIHKLITKHQQSIVVLALIAACIAIYGQTFGHELINIDDRPYVYENPAVLSGLNSRSIYWAMTAVYSGNWHPLTWLSHMLDVALFGRNPGMMHASNVVFHTLNSILALFVFKRLTGEFWQAAVIAFLFAVHPTHVESVAWVAERKDMLSTMFWLMAMLAYFRYADAVNADGTGWNKPKIVWMSITFMLMALGLMSKAMLVTLPFVLILTDYWSLGRLNKIRDLTRLFTEKLPLFALTIASSVMAIHSQSSGGATVSLQQLSIGDRLLNVSLSYAKYIVMMFYPINLGLWYPFDERLDPLKLLGSFGLLITISAFCWSQRNDRRYLLMGWLWFLGTLVPVIGLVQIGLQSLADRYTYVPYFGLFIMAVGAAAELIRRFSVPAVAVAFAAAAVIGVLGWLAFVQASYWKNSETLYTHTLSITQNNHFLMSNLCLYHVKNSPLVVAERRCTELLAAVPPTPEGFNILGLLRMDIGKYDDAVEYFEKAKKMNPNWGIIDAHLSMTLSKQGKIPEAERSMQKAGSSTDGSVNQPTMARVAFEYAVATEKRGQTDIAKRYFEKAASLDPTFTEAAENAKRLYGK